MTLVARSKNGVPIRLTDEILDQEAPVPHEEETAVAVMKVEDYLKLVPIVRQTPQGYLWSSYDAEADTLYINFKKPSHASDSELTDDDIIIRYDGDEVVGLTILHASQR
jgi:uncharacterized protein YuzE